jgi:hypothetical protein
MDNRFKKFEKLLLDNTLLKIQNQTLGDKNPKWKEWWQIVQEIIKKQIQEIAWRLHVLIKKLLIRVGSLPSKILDFR